MTVYYSTLLVICVGSIFYNISLTDKNKRKIARLFSFGLVGGWLCILMGARNYFFVGTDMPGYYRQFHILKNCSIDVFKANRFEVGYKYLNRFIGKWTDDFQVLLFAVAIAVIIAVIYIISQYSQMPMLSILCYLAFNFYQFSFSGLRQALAWSCVAFSFTMIHRKHFIAFLLWIGLATLFHISAVFFLPAYFCQFIKINKQTILAWFVTTAGTYFFRVPIANFVINRFFIHYEIMETSAYKWMTLCIVVSLCCLMGYVLSKNQSEATQLTIVLMCIGASLSVLTTITNNALRVSNYYFFFVILALPNILKTLKNNFAGVACKACVSMILVCIFLFMMKEDGFSIVPYVWMK